MSDPCYGNEVIDGIGDSEGTHLRIFVPRNCDIQNPGPSSASEASEPSKCSTTSGRSPPGASVARLERPFSGRTLSHAVAPRHVKPVTSQGRSTTCLMVPSGCSWRRRFAYRWLNHK